MTTSHDGFTVDQIGGACPTQATGRYTASDRPFYFRARHGTWALWVGEPSWQTDYLEWPTFDWYDDPSGLVAKGDDPSGGFMETPDVLTILSANVPAALVVTDWYDSNTDPATASLPPMIDPRHLNA